MSSRLVSNVRAWLRLIAFVAVLSLIAIVTVQPQSPSDSARVAGWRSDIAYYLEQLKHQHYVYSKRALPGGLIAAAKRLSENVPRYSDERILAEFEHLASFAGDGHTYMLPFGARRVVAHMLPLRFYLFSDGMYVIDAFPGYERWIGSRVVRLGDTPTSVVIDRIRPTLSADNRFGCLWIAPPFLSFRGYLENFADGIRGDPTAVSLRQSGEKDVRVQIPVVVTPTYRGVPKLMASRAKDAGPAPLYLSDVGRNFWMRQLGDSVLYFQFNQVMDAPEESLAAFAAKLATAVRTLSPRAIIV